MHLSSGDEYEANSEVRHLRESTTISMQRMLKNLTPASLSAAIIVCSFSLLFSAHAQEKQVKCFEYATRKTEYFPAIDGCPVGWFVDKTQKYADELETDKARSRLVEKSVGGALLGAAIALLFGLIAAIKPAIRYVKRHAPSLASPSDAHFSLALEEVSSGQTVKATWARALVEASGDVDRTKAAYIRMRARDLMHVEQAEVTLKNTPELRRTDWS